MRVDYSSDLPPMIGDPEALRQAIANLILNAYEAMGDGGGTVSILAGRNNGHLVLLLTDTGPGIPEHIAPRIFDPFFTTKPDGQGTGLGLAVSRSIARQHGGELTADTGPQGGAAFVLRLPIRPPSRDQSPANPTGPDTAPWLTTQGSDDDGHRGADASAPPQDHGCGRRA